MKVSVAVHDVEWLREGIVDLGDEREVDDLKRAPCEIVRVLRGDVLAFPPKDGAIMSEVMEFLSFFQAETAVRRDVVIDVVEVI